MPLICKNIYILMPLHRENKRNKKYSRTEKNGGGALTLERGADGQTRRSMLSLESSIQDTKLQLLCNTWIGWYVVYYGAYGETPPCSG